jgi:hypothetical protein
LVGAGVELAELVGLEERPGPSREAEREQLATGDVGIMGDPDAYHPQNLTMARAGVDGVTGPQVPLTHVKALSPIADLPSFGVWRSLSLSEEAAENRDHHAIPSAFL